MHSSRMRTGRSLTVCWSLLPGGGLVGGGVSAPGGSGPGGSAAGGVSALGGSAPSGWVCCRGGISQHALRQTPPRGQTDACENITLAQLRCGR